MYITLRFFIRLVQPVRGRMPWETLGGWHEETVAQVKKLASA